MLNQQKTAQQVRRFSATQELQQNPEAAANDGRGFSLAQGLQVALRQHQLNINPERTIDTMNEESKKSLNNEDIPASLRRAKKEPSTTVKFQIPLSWWSK
jgi:hypothetical protein